MSLAAGKGMSSRLSFEKPVLVSFSWWTEMTPTPRCGPRPTCSRPRRTADMVIGSRIMDGGAGHFRSVNLIGNVLYREVINVAFRTRLTDG